MNRKHKSDAKKFDQFVNAKTVGKLPAFIKRIKEERDKQKMRLYWSALREERKQAERYRYEMLCAQSNAKFWRVTCLTSYAVYGVLFIILGVMK